MEGDPYHGHRCLWLGMQSPPSHLATTATSPPPKTSFPSAFLLRLLIIQFQVQIAQIAQTGLGDYFFMATKHKRP